LAQAPRLELRAHPPQEGRGRSGTARLLTPPPLARTCGASTIMRGGRGVSAQGPSHADGAGPVAEGCSSDGVGVDVGPARGRSGSDGDLRSASGGCPARADAAREVRDSAAGRPARTDDGQDRGATVRAMSHDSLSEYASVTAGSSDSIPPSEELGHGGQYSSTSASGSSWEDLSDSRWGFSDGSQSESGSGSSGWASGSSHSESHTPRRAEEREQQDAEWLMDNEAQHAAGTCKPCLYLRTEAGCAAGRACRYCHLPHAAPSTAGRIPCKQLVRRSDSKCGGDADAVRDLADDCHLAQRHMLGAFRERDPQQGPVGAEPGGPTQAAACEKPEQFPSCG